MNKYISFSGGVESTTMCILYGKGAKETKPQTVTCNHPNNKPDKEDGGNELR